MAPVLTAGHSAQTLSHKAAAIPKAGTKDYIDGFLNVNSGLYPRHKSIWLKYFIPFGYC
jgi:hypothetical protein